MKGKKGRRRQLRIRSARARAMGGAPKSWAVRQANKRGTSGTPGAGKSTGYSHK